MIRPTLPLRFATPVTPGRSGPLRQQPFALLPPIPLYRRILRAHRHKLSVSERILGDQYVKSEFRLHRKIDNPVQIIGFLTEWQMYAQLLEGDSWKEEVLDRTKLDKMSDQQIGQLYELMQAIQKQGEDADDE